MEEQIRHAERFVADMLQYGRPRPLEVRKVQLAPLVELAMSTVRTAIGESAAAAEFTLDSAGDLPIEADQAQLSQVFVVLFDNSLRVLAVRPNPRIKASVESAGTHVLVRVEDNGPGIAPELLPRVFEAFVTGRSGDGQRQGTGLGLAIARAVVTRHGGTIRAGRSALGGAQFDVELPMQQPLIAAAAEIA